MATVLIAFVLMFSEFGLGPAVVQKRDVDDELLRRVFGLVLVIHVSLTGMLVLGARLIASFYAEPRVIPVVQVLSLQFIIAAFRSSRMPSCSDEWNPATARCSICPVRWSAAPRRSRWHSWVRRVGARYGLPAWSVVENHRDQLAFTFRSLAGFLG